MTTNLTIKCPECELGIIMSHNKPKIECPTCKGTGSVPVEVLSAEEIYEGFCQTDEDKQIKFIKLSDAQKLIEAEEKKFLKILCGLFVGRLLPDGWIEGTEFESIESLKEYLPKYFEAVNTNFKAERNKIIQLEKENKRWLNIHTGDQALLEAERNKVLDEVEKFNLSNEGINKVGFNQNQFDSLIIDSIIQFKREFKEQQLKRLR